MKPPHDSDKAQEVARIALHRAGIPGFTLPEDADGRPGVTITLDSQHHRDAAVGVLSSLPGRPQVTVQGLRNIRAVWGR